MQVDNPTINTNFSGMNSKNYINFVNDKNSHLNPGVHARSIRKLSDTSSISESDNEHDVSIQLDLDVHDCSESDRRSSSPVLIGSPDNDDNVIKPRARSESTRQTREARVQSMLSFPDTLDNNNNNDKDNNNNNDKDNNDRLVVKPRKRGATTQSRKSQRPQSILSFSNDDLESSLNNNNSNSNNVNDASSTSNDNNNKKTDNESEE
eukprot:Pgem_evm1s6284